MGPGNRGHRRGPSDPARARPPVRGRRRPRRRRPRRRPSPATPHRATGGRPRHRRRRPARADRGQRAGPVPRATSAGCYVIAPAAGPRPCCILAAVPDQQPPSPIQRVVDAAARKGVTLEVHTFAESTHTAEDAAAAVGAELGQIVKSLVFVAPSPDATLQPILCLVSGPNRVDLARLAAVTAEPDVRRATAVEARDLTGFVIGGIPPIGHQTGVRVVMDPDLGRFQVVWAAAGTPTAVFPVAPGTPRMLANAPVAPICEERRQADVLAEGAGLAGTPIPQPNAGA